MTHVDHGWRHASKAAGGTDPIPGGGGGPWDSTQNVGLVYGIRSLPEFAEFENQGWILTADGEGGSTWLAPEQQLGQSIAFSQTSGVDLVEDAALDLSEFSNLNDIHSWWSSGNPTRITFDVDGLYHISFTTRQTAL